MKTISFAVFVLIAFALSAFGNPIGVYSFRDADIFLVQALIVFASLLAESVVVALLAKRKRLIRDTILWLLVTLGTFCLLVLVPFEVLKWELTDFASLYDRRVIYLEGIIIFVEGLILWLLWLRKSGVHIAYSFLISFAGNALSYAVSLALFYPAFADTVITI